MSSFPINFYYGANKSWNTLVLDEHKHLSFWFDLPIADKVFLSLILIVSVLIGLIGKYAVLKRITQTGIIAYPLNPMMFYHEIIYTAYRVSRQVLDPFKSETMIKVCPDVIRILKVEWFSPGLGSTIQLGFLIDLA